MTKRRRKRIVERVKSVLILLLSCSAVYLVTLIQSTVVPSGLLSHPSTGGGGLAAADPAETAPAAAHGGGDPRRRERGTALRRAVQRRGYGGSVPAGLYDPGGGAEQRQPSPKEVTEAEWRQALAAAPVCTLTGRGRCLWRCLDGWLSVDNPLADRIGAADGAGRREGRVFLCYFDETAGRYYACGSDVVSVRRLEEVVEALRDNGARFAFETEEYDGLEPYTLVLEQPLSPAVYASVDPLEGGQRWGTCRRRWISQRAPPPSAAWMSRSSAAGTIRCGSARTAL